MSIEELLQRVNNFHSECSSLLGKHEDALATRVFHARQTLERVNTLSFEQSDALKQAVRCVESGLFKAAFVIAWTAPADLLLGLGERKKAEIKVVRPKWEYHDKTSLSETQSDYAIIEALKEGKVIGKSDMKTLHGLLHRRNQCAHPSQVHPDANAALGYISETIPVCLKLHNIP